jgi:hypothetical protein
VQPGQPRAAVQRGDQRVGDVPAVRIGSAGDQAGSGGPRRGQQRGVVAGQDRHRAGTPAGDLHDDAARAAQDVAAAHIAQVGADQPGAGAQAHQPGRPHPPGRRRLRAGQGEVAVDLRRAVRLLGPLPRQRHAGRIQVRHHAAGDEPLVGAQRPPRHPGQARRAAGEPLDHRRVEHDPGLQVQAQRRRVIREPARRPQQVLRPLPPFRGHRRDHAPGERRPLRRHRRRPPAGDIAGDRASASGRRRSRPGLLNHTVSIQ